jgi:hypothetical protein
MSDHLKAPGFNVSRAEIIQQTLIDSFRPLNLFQACTILSRNSQSQRSNLK